MPSKLVLQEEALEELEKHPDGIRTPLDKISPVFPFGVPAQVAKINGTGYLTAQTLVQQVAYTLSDRLFTYSPETFALDNAVKKWSGAAQVNGRGVVTSVESMETRLGAANVLLGYIFSADSKKRDVAQTIIASSPSLTPMRSALDQLALLYHLSSPFVAHIAAVDYEVSTGKLVTDYVTAINVAQETGAGLVASFSAHEAQHMALFATLAGTVLPMVHIYDGVRVARESVKVTDILDQTGLQNVFESIVSEKGGKTDQVANVGRILKSLNAELGTAYSLFEYEGHEKAETVLVVFGSVESALASPVAASLAKSGEKVGVISARVYRPFSDEHFLEVLPKTVKRIAVLGQVLDQLAVQDPNTSSPLFVDVIAAVTLSDIWSLPPPIVDIKYARSHEWTPKGLAWILEQILHKQIITLDIPKNALTQEAAAVDSFELMSHDPNARQLTFWDIDDSATAPAAAVIAKFLAGDPSKNISFSAIYDNAPLAGTLYSEIRSSHADVEAPFRVEGADVTFVGDAQLLSKFNVPATVKCGGVIIVKASIAPEDLEKKLPAAFRRALVKKNINLVLVDTASAGEEVAGAVENAIVQLAALAAINTTVSIDKLGSLNHDSEAASKASELAEKVVRKIEVSKEWAEGEITEALAVAAQATAFTTNKEKHALEPASVLRSWQSAAQALCFKEAYGVKSALRPELSIENFIVKVKENKRLTPLDYDRNIFHIEFDLTGTGLTYDIGEALGIHSHNDADDVVEFINRYGLDTDDLVQVPSREDPDVLEVRTVFQALQQNIDIFGRPPKKFYESLSEYATDVEEKKKLLALCSADGTIEFKRRAEVDTVTFADILQEHPSAHPPFEELVKIVSPLKRREYSIASSQKANPDSVHLLVVVVNWTDTKGRERWGQATRYLSCLPIGAEVVVSVKPSVMKLPASTEAPLIMAGLGTGLAPFRAFVQHRAWQQAQGLPIGPVMLYMGSRHQRQEYLYGEEWEAYIAAGIITHMGAAFSRDQKQKIYIQDRMRQSLEEVRKNYLEKGGAFYLCGPTWPVPDVAAVLEDAIRLHGKKSGKKVEVGREMEKLKDQGRYVLEVY